MTITLDGYRDREALAAEVAETGVLWGIDRSRDEQIIAAVVNALVKSLPAERSCAEMELYALCRGIQDCVQEDGIL